MLPTKGYFQDIACPFYNSSCGRPYCHFRHRRKPNENVEEILPEKSESTVPTYKPTPKSELANIHNSKSHIPISYVPDLAYRSERTIRPITRVEKPTYKPTPLSLLSSASKLDSKSPENDEHKETIKDIQQNIASNEYDPSKSEINFEDLTNEFDLIDEIINEDEAEPQALIEDNLSKIASDIEKEQNRLNLLKSELKTSDLVGDKGEKSGENAEEVGENDVKKEITGEKQSSDKSKGKRESRREKNSDKDIKNSSGKSKTKKSGDKSDGLNRNKDRHSSSKEKHLKTKEPSKEKEKSSERSDKSTKSLKSSERETHRKEEKKESKDRSKISKKKSRERSKSPRKERDKKKSVRKRRSSTNDSRGSSNESGEEKEKHRKEKKKDGKMREKSQKISGQKENKDRKHTSKSRSRSRSSSKTKQSRQKEKEKKKSKSKEDLKLSGKSKEKGSSSKKSRKDKKDKHKKKSTSESSSANDNEHDVFPMETPMAEEEIVPSDIDLDLEDDDETMRECYRIFNEYKPEPVQEKFRFEKSDNKGLFEEEDVTVSYQGKKRTAHQGAETSSTLTKIPPPAKPKPISTPGQTLANRYKIAKMAQGTNEQENIMNEIKQITQLPVKRPATSLLEAARLHKMKRVQEQKMREKKTPTNMVDDILNGTHKPVTPQAKMQPKKIAAVPNVALIEKAKERISLIKRQTGLHAAKTVAQTQKAGRVAHIPEFSLSDIPDVLHVEKSKLPVNVRTRFLTMIADECSKLYALKEDAYTRALNEEFSCYEKCKVITTYRNSAMLAVNRLRKEIQERENKGLGPLLSGESNASEKGTDYKGKRFYDNVKKWILTEEELDIHGYPKESVAKGKAVINNRAEVDYSIVDENQRKCSRCSKIYQVDDDGWPLFDEECMYHPLKKRTIRGEQVFLCCKSNDDTGCVTSDTHVFDGLPSYQLEGFQVTIPSETENDPRSVAVYALDCEMCYTTKGLELTRVTIVDTECKTVYESFVKPLNPIIDYNTRFSGITKEQMDRTSTSILQIQANILHLCNSETILVGHSLESDLKALKIVHATVIDTSVLFPHKMGLPHKRALRALASELLKKIIQNDVSGHDSAEDAVTCMELIKWKLREELKVRTK